MQMRDLSGRAGVRRWFYIAVFLALQAHALAQAPCSGDPRDIIRRTAENDINNELKARNYTFVQQQVEHKLNSDGSVQSTSSKTREFMVLYGEPVARRVAKDGHPLSAEEQKKEDERIEKMMKKWETETAEQRQKRLAKYDKEREQGREFVREVTDAYYFTMLPVEKINGREACVIHAEPKPGFHPRSRDAKILPKMRGTMWIDKNELQWAKVDAEVLDTISFGVWLARIHRGSRLVIEQTRVNDEIWLPSRVDVKLDARVALLKKYNLEAESTFSDYKKFRSESRMVMGPEPAGGTGSEQPGGDNSEH